MPEVTEEAIPLDEEDFALIEHKARARVVLYGSGIGELEYHILLEDPLNVGRAIGITVQVDENGHVTTHVGDHHDTLIDLDPPYEDPRDFDSTEKEDEVPNLYAGKIDMPEAFRRLIAWYARSNAEASVEYFTERLAQYQPHH